MQRSAGVLIHRHGPRGTEVLLVHPGGPYWRNRDQGAWQIAKGGIDPGEAPELAARREVEEELGLVLTTALTPLGEIRQAGGKQVVAYAAEQDFDPARLTSITFELEWPPRSGRIEHYPEVDDARWLTLDEARAAMLPSQLPLLDRLAELLG
ncbi:MAG: NUDIX domain-containing protein [Croceibacterium sp.]